MWYNNIITAYLGQIVIYFFAKSHLLHKFSLLVTKIGHQTGATETNWSHAIAMVPKLL